MTNAELAAKYEKQGWIDIGMYDDADEFKAIIDALKGLAVPTFHEIGFLSRNRDGEIRWHQTSNMLPFPLHATVNVYMKGVPGSKPQHYADKA